MHRFFVSQADLKNAHFTSREPSLCHQLSKVLKMRPGEQSILCANDEKEHLVKWTLISKPQCSADILESNNKPDISSSRPIHLAVALLKNQNRWEWMLEKCTELGAASFTPLITQRTEITELRKLDRLHRIIQEAAEQSGRTLLPTLNDPIQFSDLLKQEGAKVIAKPHHPLNSAQGQLQNTSKADIGLRSIPEHGNRPPSPDKERGLGGEVGGVTLCIGPEGGFTEEEEQQAFENKCLPISLGEQTLRTETAAIVGCAKLISG